MSNRVQEPDIALSLRGRLASIFSRLPRRRRLWHLLAVLAPMVLFLTIWRDWAEYRNVGRNAEMATSSFARIGRLEITRVLRPVDSLLQDVALLSDRLTDEGLTMRLSVVPGLWALFVVDAEGGLVAGIPPGKVPADFRTQSYFQEAQKGQLVIDLPEDESWRSLVVARAIYDKEGTFKGIAAAAVETRIFEEALNLLGDKESISALVALRNGKILLRQGEAAIEERLHVPPTDFTAGPVVRWEQSLADVPERLVAYEAVSDTPLIVAVALAHERVYERWAFQAIAQIVILGVFFLIAAFLLRRLEDREEEHARHSSALAAEAHVREVLLDLLPVPVFIKDGQGRYIAVNRAMSESVQRPIKELLGRTVYDWGSNTSVMHDGADRDLIRNGGQAIYDGVVHRADGHLIEATFYKAAIDLSENERGVIGVILDTSQAKAAERKLAVAAARIERMIDSMLDAVVTIDQKGIVRSFSRSAERMLGWSREEVIGKNVSMLMPEPYASRHGQYLDDYLRGDSPHVIGRGREVEAKAKDGRLISVLLSVSELAGGVDDAPREFIGTLTDITDRKAVEKSLLLAKEQAELANRSKSEFLANMSHELRTPLNSILGYSEMLTHQYFGAINDKQRDYLNTVHTAGSHLLAIINDILDLSRIEVGELSLDEREIDLAALMRECLHFIEGRAVRGGVNLDFDIDQPYWLLGDSLRLKQIFLNLLSNAVKFTRPGGVVSARTEKRADGALTIAFSDTGIGMTAEQIEIAKQPFRQVENAYSRSHEGTGLGLPIAIRLVKLHDASLDIASEMGKGTTVRITFPAHRLSKAPQFSE